MDELKQWLNEQITFNDKMGDESRKMEIAADKPFVVSSGHYQRSVAYKRVLRRLSQIKLL